MERQLIGTVGIAVVASLVTAPFFLGLRGEEPVRILKNEFPDRLAVAVSDSLGENAFEFGFVVNRDCVEVSVGFRFLYGQNLAVSKEEKLNATFDRISALQVMIPVQSRTIRTGYTSYNGTRVRYTLYDFTGSPGLRAESTSTFLMLDDDSEVLASFWGVSDLFPERSGSLIDATVIRSGNRTLYSRRALGEALVLPIANLPGCPFVFNDVRKGETIAVSYRSDAFFSRPQGGGAVQIVNVDCDGAEEVLLFNFIG